jgi:hypothetical protein
MSDWQDERPPAPSYLRVLYLGRMLQDDETLVGECLQDFFDIELLSFCRILVLCISTVCCHLLLASAHTEISSSFVMIVPATPAAFTPHFYTDMPPD